jgi:hypothetical protein
MTGLFLMVPGRAPRKNQRPQVKQLKLTQNAKVLLRYYLDLGQELGDTFYRSLDRIAEETALPKRSVTWANTRLQDLGLIAWVRGFGGPAVKRGLPNQYIIKPAAKGLNKEMLPLIHRLEGIHGYMDTGI